ncbi:hypothetical protein [Streptomyces antibioticus]
MEGTLRGRSAAAVGLPPVAIVVLRGEFISNVGSGATLPYLVVY